MAAAQWHKAALNKSWSLNVWRKNFYIYTSLEFLFYPCFCSHQQTRRSLICLAVFLFISFCPSILLKSVTFLSRICTDQGPPQHLPITSEGRRALNLSLALELEIERYPDSNRNWKVRSRPFLFISCCIYFVFDCTSPEQARAREIQSHTVIPITTNVSLTRWPQKICLQSCLSNW